MNASLGAEPVILVVGKPVKGSAGPGIGPDPGDTLSAPASPPFKGNGQAGGTCAAGEPTGWSRLVGKKEGR